MKKLTTVALVAASLVMAGIFLQEQALAEEVIVTSTNLIVETTTPVVVSTNSVQVSLEVNRISYLPATGEVVATLAYKVEDGSTVARGTANITTDETGTNYVVYVRAIRGRPAQTLTVPKAVLDAQGYSTLMSGLDSMAGVVGTMVVEAE